MHPSWISESYKVWLRGDDVDLREVSIFALPIWLCNLILLMTEQSVSQHRLPIFNDVVVTLTGIPSVERRMEINRLVTKHGGSYVKNLERPVKVTHLICSRDLPHTTGDGEDVEVQDGPWASEKSEKMIYAEKFNDRGEANIHIIWEEWLWDCLTYGGMYFTPLYASPYPDAFASCR